MQFHLISHKNITERFDIVNLSHFAVVVKYNL